MKRRGRRAVVAPRSQPQWGWGLGAGGSLGHCSRPALPGAGLGSGAASPPWQLPGCLLKNFTPSGAPPRATATSASARYRPAGCPKGPGPIVPALTAAAGPLSASSPYSPPQAGPPTPPAAAPLLSAPWRWLVAMVKLAAKCILAGESENLRANTESGVQRLHELLRASVQGSCLPSSPFSVPEAS